MKVFIFGNQGNMGRRYASVLRYLGHEVFGCEAGDSMAAWNRDYLESDAIIIATDTPNHMPILNFLVPEGKPVLCEKPFSTEIEKVKEFVEWAEQAEMKISMVSQYDYLLPIHPSHGDTVYDFYRSGKDGIAWDCINIIWHAQGRIFLKNESPVWKCKINGYTINAGQIDYSYVETIETWLKDAYEPQYERILNSHKKVLDYLDGKFK